MVVVGQSLRCGRIFLISGMLWFAISSAVAQSSPTAAQRAIIQRLEHRLMAPCCYTQTISDHMSEISYQMRNEVASMVMAGRSEEEIVGYYRKQYGDKILVVPDGASGAVAFAVPPTVLLTGILLLTWMLRRWHKRSKFLPSAVGAPVDAYAQNPNLHRVRAEVGEI